MADPLRRAQPGRRQNIPTDAYNAFVEAAQAERLDRFGGGPESGAKRPSMATNSQTTILVQNNTNSHLGQLAAVEPYDHAIPPRWFMRDYTTQPILKVRLPTSDYGRYCVLLDPIGQGRIGRAAIAGVVPAYLYFDSEFLTSYDSYMVAVTKTNDNRMYLRKRSDSRDFKSYAEVIWTSHTTPFGPSFLPLPGVVRLSADRYYTPPTSGIVVSRSSTSTLTSPVEWSSESNNSGPETFFYDSGDPAYLIVPVDGLYQLQVHYKISNPSANTTFETWFQGYSSGTVYGRATQYIGGTPLACYLSSHAMVYCEATEAFSAHITASTWPVSATIEGRWSLYLVGAWLT